MISKARIKLIRSLELKKNRKAHGMFVAEGPKVVADLMAVQKPLMVAALPAWIDANGHLLAQDTEVYDISDDELRRLSFLQHPQQVMAVFAIPDYQTADSCPALPSPKADVLALALDSVQDPGNLGTIIRIADWFGIEDIYCSHDTADVWNPKVVQATMGSIARVRVHYINLPEFIDNLPEGYPVYGTLLDGDDINKADIHNRGLIVMGNEGNGISPDVARRVTHRLLIPNYPEGRPTADSLNVAIATAITAFAIRYKG